MKCCYSIQNGLGPLWIASVKGHLDIVNTLIGAGAIINQGDKVGSQVSNMHVLYGHHIVKPLNVQTFP